MATSVFQTKGVASVVIALLLAAGPALADKPSWAGRHAGADERWPDRRDYSGNARGDRAHGRRDGGDDPLYQDRQHWDRRDDQRYGDRNGPIYRGGRYFVDQQRTVIHNYYYDDYRHGSCPPGLAKKHNGCMPPGQVRRWAIGRPLPREVVFYDVPQPVLIGLGYPPPGYRFVRVASDILMIAIGTGLVMDAVYDLGGGW